ncbi:MAG TPA: phage Gp37/Gp68 family protein [Thermoanaerobaculia bacterium]|nr:phage Gp37/Gp68 family protein [Thermoanaerobaculia bacterium]
MGENTSITWCHHTFNGWIGCAKVSPGCANCYAEALMDKRYGRVEWGKGNPRVVTSEANWRQPLRWNHRAILDGVRRRVFTASLADVFDAEAPEDAQVRLFDLIEECAALDWLVLTKRPENALAFAAERPLPDNVWIGVSVENQAAADERIPILLQIPATVRFLSVEPLLGPVDVAQALTYNRDPETSGAPLLARMPGIDWVIVGGESGPGARPCEVEWVRSIVAQCRAASVPVFVKQLGANVRDRNDRGWEGEEPDHWPEEIVADDRVEHDPNGFREEYQGAPVRVHLRDRKGGEWLEWPEELRVRQFPEVRG